MRWIEVLAGHDELVPDWTRQFNGMVRNAWFVLWLEEQVDDSEYYTEFDARQGA